MKFLFLAIRCTPFDGKTLEERPLGGTETGVIAIADNLAASGHEVYVAVGAADPKQGMATYINVNDYHKVGDVDVLIVVRYWRSLFWPIKAKKRFYWSGDSVNIIHNLGIGDPRFYNTVDALITVSDWHADVLCKASGFPRNKAWTLRNGVFLSNFKGEESRVRKRLIYSSLPNRGLIYMPHIFLALKKKHPELEFHIFSGSLRDSPAWPPDNKWILEWKNLISLFKTIKGCYLHGYVLQKQLAREFMRSSVWVYPTAFEETSCISAMEAQAAGCAVVTSKLAAIPETVGDAGILIPDVLPPKEEYLQKYIEAVDRVLTDDSLFQTLSGKGIERSKSFDWSLRAQSLMEYIGKRLETG